LAGIEGGNLRRRLFNSLVILLVVLLTISAAGLGYLAGISGRQDQGGVFAPFWQAWDIVHTEYLDQPVDDIKLVQGAIDGLMRSLGDENSSYMDPITFEIANTSISGYEGIGAEVDTSGSLLKIVTPFPGSPAEKAGLKAGDQILRIDGEDMAGINPELVRKKVLGPAGSHIVLTIQREGVKDPFTVDIIRGKIQLPTMESEMLPEKIGYIHLYLFSSNSGDLLTSALENLMSQNPKGLILDLRGNPGGLVESALDVASQFLPENTLVLTEKRGSEETRDVTRAGGLAIEVPLVVLVDKGSASASEIVAGAIQDHGRGILVGETTYGKGSEQFWIPLVNNQGAIRVTIARWYTPNGRQISKIGLTPDYAVPYTEDDFNADRDPQRAKAIELLQQEGG
jgi:carboxyl-terminal processing protease